MLDGVINGIWAGLGAGAGIALSRFIIRPFFSNYINPHFLRLKDRYKRIRYSDDYFRTLSTEELEWADKSAQEMVADVFNSKKIGVLAGTFYVIIGILFFILCICLFPMISMALIKAFQVPEPWGALSWYNIETIGPSTILAIFVGICVMAAISSGVFLLTKNPNRYYDSFFGKYRQSTHSYWKSEIFELIRKRKVSIHTAPNLSLIGKTPFKKFSKTYGAWGLALSGITLVLLIFDIKNNTVIFDKHIEHSPYTSLTTRTYEAADIVEAKRSCHIVVRGKHQTRPKATLKYKLVMSDGREVTIYGRDEGASQRKQINALKHWHELIPAEKLTPTVITSTDEKEKPATKLACRSVVRCSCENDAYNKLKRIFDLSR